MGRELFEAGNVLATYPFSTGTRAVVPFTAGKEFAVRVRDGIVFRLNFHLDTRLEVVVIEDSMVTPPTR